MITISTVLIIICVVLGTVTLAAMLLVGNLLYNIAMANQKLMGALQLVHKEATLAVAGLEKQAEVLARIEKMSDAVFTATETLVDIAGSRMGHATSLREGDYFSTEDGKIKANNINDFIEKLKQDPTYMDIAEELRVQLENELAEDDDSEPPFTK